MTFSEMSAHLRRLGLLNDFVLTVSSAQNMDQIARRMFGLLTRAFNTEDIESIEIIRGPAAATLYGTEASNGVIQIFTKRGNVGAPRWNVSVQQEAIQMPDVVAPNSFFTRSQTVSDAIAPILGYNPTPFQVYEEPIFKDFLRETGGANTITAQVQGGTPTVTYFVSMRNQTEDGPFGNNAFGPADDLARRQQATGPFAICNK